MRQKTSPLTFAPKVTLGPHSGFTGDQLQSTEREFQERETFTPETRVTLELCSDKLKIGSAIPLIFVTIESLR